MDWCTGNLEEKIQVDVVYTGLTKCFEKNKLDWIKLKREKSIRVNWWKVLIGVDCTSGVPQGFIWVHSFFIYVNSIHFAISFVYTWSEYVLSIRNLADCFTIRIELDSFLKFCTLIFLNIEKCSHSRSQWAIFCNYKIDETVLTRVTNIKDLGVIFDFKFLFCILIESIIVSASTMLGYVFRQCKPFKKKVTSYTCMLRIRLQPLEHCITNLELAV